MTERSASSRVVQCAVSMTWFPNSVELLITVAARLAGEDLYSVLKMLAEALGKVEERSTAAMFEIILGSFCLNQEAAQTVISLSRPTNGEDYFNRLTTVLESLSITSTQLDEPPATPYLH